MPLPTLPLPDFAFDTDTNYGVIVIGRAIEEGVLTPPSRVQAVHAAVNAWAERTGLPLAYVHMGTTINWDFDEDEDDGECSGGVVGLVTAYVDGLAGDAAAVKFEKSALDPAQFARIPNELWTQLEGELGVKFGRSERRGDTYEEVDEPGVYLAPAGWTVASLYLTSTAELGESGRPEGKPAVSTATEDTTVGKRLDTETYAHLRTTEDELLIWATYC